MSTFIKVEQGDSDLLRRNIEQTQANRLAKVERDEQARTGKQAQDERRQSLAQRGLDASGNAVAGNRRRWLRKDEPGAFRAPSDGLIISWNGITPVLNDRRALITDQYGFNAVASTIFSTSAVEVFSFFPDPDLREGSWYVSAKPYFDVTSINSCTLEAWGELVGAGGGPVGSRYAIDLRVGWVYDPLVTDATATIFCIYSFAPSGLSIPEAIPPYQRDPGLFFSCFSTISEEFSGDDEIFISNSPPIGPSHVCIQIVNYRAYFYLNGVQFLSYPIPAQPIPTAELSLSVIARSIETSSSARLSQVRFTTTRARYPVAGFTPNPMPFR